VFLLLNFSDVILWRIGSDVRHIADASQHVAVPMRTVTAAVAVVAAAGCCGAPQF